jgi:hypothetical protein
MVEKKWRMRMSPSRWCIRILVDMKGTQVNAEDEATWRGCRDAILRGKTEAMEFKFFERSIGELGAGGGGCCVILWRNEIFGLYDEDFLEWYSCTGGFSICDIPNSHADTGKISGTGPNGTILLLEAPA